MGPGVEKEGVAKWDRKGEGAEGSKPRAVWRKNCDQKGVRPRWGGRQRESKEARGRKGGLEVSK